MNVMLEPKIDLHIVAIYVTSCSDLRDLYNTVVVRIRRVAYGAVCPMMCEQISHAM